MDRDDKILKYISKRGMGVEIGPSHSPIASRKKGYTVDIIDHLGKTELIEKYRDHNVNLDNIEEVNFIWKGESYDQLTGKSKHYDWIIASHVIEHTPDFIGFLQECDSILKDDGVISLVVPDKRYCFDHFRPMTGISQIIDSHIQRNKIHSPGSVVEYFLNVVQMNGQIAWNSTTSTEFEFIHSLNDAKSGMRAVMNDNAYLDVHAWCFIPSSFRLMIHDLHSLGLISFKEIEFHETSGCEFYITLGRKGLGIERTRMEMLELITLESCGLEQTHDGS